MVEDEAGRAPGGGDDARGAGLHRARSRRRRAGALEILDAHPEIALLITDVVMPGDERPTARRAKRVRVARTCKRALHDRLHAQRHRAPWYSRSGVQLIAKPYTLEALSLKISEVLSSAARPTVDA